MPHFLHAYKISGQILPLKSGGEQRTLLGHLAINDGIPSIKTVENKGAVPPGI